MEGNISYNMWRQCSIFGSKPTSILSYISDMSDSIVAAVIKKFQERSDLGQKKYGTTLDRTDLKTLDWIQHAQEELMDGILYLEKLKQSFSHPVISTQHPRREPVPSNQLQ